MSESVKATTARHCAEEESEFKSMKRRHFVIIAIIVVFVSILTVVIWVLIEKLKHKPCVPPPVRGPPFVLPTDVILVPPPKSLNSSLRQGNDGPIIAPIVGYSWRILANLSDYHFEMPIYYTLSSKTIEYWNNIVDELLLTRVPMALLSGRGCWSKTGGYNGPGNMCPRALGMFVKAVDIAGARNVIRVGMFDNTGAHRVIAGVERLDLSNKSNWDYFWSYNYKIWFDTIPKDMWYLLDGKPMIAAWTLSDAFFQNQEGHASQMLTWISEQFQQRYGMEPAFILQDSWFETDSTISTQQATGQHGWFSPKYNVPNSIFSFRNFNGVNWGVSAPGYQNGNSLPNCGDTCRAVPRLNGTTLTAALHSGQNAFWMMLEGWTDMVESAGYYRSTSWEYPTQYINIVRTFTDPAPETIRFEAEGADSFFDTTPANLGGSYSNRSLDVAAFENRTGWYVGWIVNGEWLEYQGVQLGCGTYRFTVRAATSAGGRRLRMDIGNLSAIELPSTGSLNNYSLFHLGEAALVDGIYNLRLVFESTGDLHVDWFFLKKSG